MQLPVHMSMDSITPFFVLQYSVAAGYRGAWGLAPPSSEPADPGPGCLSLSAVGRRASPSAASGLSAVCVVYFKCLYRTPAPALLAHMTQTRGQRPAGPRHGPRVGRDSKPGDSESNVPLNLNLSFNELKREEPSALSCALCIMLLLLLSSLSTRSRNCTALDKSPWELAPI